MNASARIVTSEMWLELTAGEPVELFVLDADALRTRYDAIERIYCGSDTCIREFEAAVSHFEQLQQLGKPLTVVAPPLPQRSFPRFEKFLLTIKPTQAALEICVNDLGAFARAAAIIREAGASDCCQVTIGRWLARQDTDPQLAVFCDQRRGASDCSPRLVQVDGEVRRLSYQPPSPALQLHWSTPSIFGASTRGVFRRLLSANYVGNTEDDGSAGGNSAAPARPLRVELDQQANLAPAPDGLEISLHTEGALVSMLPCRDCAHCPTKTQLFGTDRFSTPLCRKRNALITRSLLQ